MTKPTPKRIIESTTTSSKIASATQGLDHQMKVYRLEATIAVSDQRIPRVHGSRRHKVEVTANGKHQMMRYQQVDSGQQTFGWIMWRRLHSASPCIFWLWGTPKRTPRVYLDGLTNEARKCKKVRWNIISIHNKSVPIYNLHTYLHKFTSLSKNTSGVTSVCPMTVCAWFCELCGCVHYILGFNLQFSRQQRVQCKQ